MMVPINVAVIGAGHIGGTIGRKWAQAGHSVLYGVRDPNSPKLRELAPAGQQAVQAASPGEAIAAGEVILLAIPGSEVSKLLDQHAGLLVGKIIIDATNQVGQPVMNAMNLLASRAPAARLYRAFNSLGWENFENPELEGSQIDLFYCGTPGESQKIVDGLIAGTGLRPIYVGGIEMAETIDHLTRLWFALVRGQNYGRRTAFKLLNEQEGS